MPNFSNHCGRRFGRLTALRRVRSSAKSKWRCMCDCRNKVTVASTNLVTGHTTSCGCARIKHGLGGTREYDSWNAMHNRCYSPTDIGYSRYGARGIQVCARWFDVRAFVQDMGKRPANRSLDRIDNNGHYMPSNCKWSTRSEQQNNKSNTRRLSSQGITKTICEWAKIIRVDPNTIRARLNRGWPVEKAVSVPRK